MSWSQRIATGLAVGAAALALPLAASPASASDWELAGGFGDYKTCIIEGDQYVNEEGNDDLTEFKCEKGGSGWQVWVR